MTDTSETATPPEEVEQAPPEPETVHGAPVSYSRGQRVVHATRENYLSVVKGLKDDGFDFFCDITGVDYLAAPDRELPVGMEPERFEVVVNLLSRTLRERIRVRVQVPDSDPTVPSLFDVWPGSEAPEREVFDLLGIVFTDHPDLSRIMMPEEWEGHPLRKDYAVGRVPVQFKAPPATR